MFPILEPLFILLGLPVILCVCAIYFSYKKIKINWIKYVIILLIILLLVLYISWLINAVMSSKACCF
jgi:hypothetical protein